MESFHNNFVLPVLMYQENCRCVEEPVNQKNEPVKNDKEKDKAATPV
jgi:hypothetical protein